MDARVGLLCESPLSRDQDLELRRELEARITDSSRLAFRVAYGVLRRREDAEDVAQEALVRACERYPSLRDRERFPAWLVRTTWRLALDHCRGRRRRERRELEALDAPTPEDAEAAAAANEFRGRLLAAIDALPEKLRIVVVLAGIEGHGMREIAALLALPEGTVKSRLHLARRRLLEGSMSCDRYTHDLPDVALGGVASADLAAHLGGCDACRAEVDRLVSLQARIERELGELMGEEPSPGFVARVRRRLDESRRERPRLGWLLPAAAALAVVLLGVRVLDRKAGAPSAGPQRAVVASPPPAVPQQAEAEATPPPPRPPIRSRPEPAAAPEVLVPKEQEELLRRLVRAMDEHPQPFASWTSTESESMAVSGIDVARIQVIPLKLELNDLKPLQIENEEGAS